LQNAHVKELAAKNSQITSLGNSVNALSREKNSIFDQLQLRQAELESSQFHSQSLQSQNTELQYQLREYQDRIVVLNEELAETRREQDGKVRAPTTSAEDVARLLSAAEAKHEFKIDELRRNLAAVEKERNECEADWSRKLREKTRETDELKRVLQSSAKTRDEKEGVVGSLRAEVDRLREEVTSYQRQVSGLQLRADNIKDIEVGSFVTDHFSVPDSLERRLPINNYWK
jgi:chromosome segregation ATPase